MRLWLRACAPVAILALLMLSGCVGSNNVSIAGQGQKSGSESRELDCDSDGQIAVGIQGQGTVQVTVRDGGGDTVYSNGFSGSGQEGETKDLDGDAGTWRLTVSFSGGSLFPSGFNGQYGITLSC